MGHRKLCSGFANAAQTLQHHLLMCLKLLGVMVERYKKRCAQRLLDADGSVEILARSAARTRAGSAGSQPSPRLPQIAVGAEMAPPGLPWIPRRVEDFSGCDLDGNRFLLSTVMLDSSLREALSRTEMAQASCFQDFPETTGCQQDEFISFDGTLTTVYEDEDAETKQQRLELPQENLIEVSEHKSLQAAYMRLLGNVTEINEERSDCAPKIVRLEGLRQELRAERSKRDGDSPKSPKSDRAKGSDKGRRVPIVVEGLDIRAELHGESDVMVDESETSRLAENMRRLSTDVHEARARASEAKVRAEEAACKALAWDHEKVELVEIIEREKYENAAEAKALIESESASADGTPSLLNAVAALLHRRKEKLESDLRKRQDSLATAAPAGGDGDVAAGGRAERGTCEDQSNGAGHDRANELGPRSDTEAKLVQLTTRFTEVQQQYRDLVSENCRLKEKLANNHANTAAPALTASGGKMMATTFEHRTGSRSCSSERSPVGGADEHWRPSQEHNTFNSNAGSDILPPDAICDLQAVWQSPACTPPPWPVTSQGVAQYKARATKSAEAPAGGSTTFPSGTSLSEDAAQRHTRSARSLEAPAGDSAYLRPNSVDHWHESDYTEPVQSSDSQLGTSQFGDRRGRPAHPEVGRANRGARAGRDNQFATRNSELAPRTVVSQTPQSHNNTYKSLRKRANLVGPTSAVGNGGAAWSENRQLARNASRYARNYGDGQALGETIGVSGRDWQDADQQPAPEPLPESGLPSPPLPVPNPASTVSSASSSAVAPSGNSSVATPTGQTGSHAAPVGSVAAAACSALSSLPSRVVTVPSSWDGQQRSGSASQSRSQRVQLLPSPPYPPPSAPPPEFPRPQGVSSQGGRVGVQPHGRASSPVAATFPPGAQLLQTRSPSARSVGANEFAAPCVARSLSPPGAGPALIHSPSVSPERGIQALSPLLSQQRAQAAHHSKSPSAGVRQPQSPGGHSRSGLPPSPPLGSSVPRSPSPVVLPKPGSPPAVLIANGTRNPARTTWPTSAMLQKPRVPVPGR